MINPYNTLFAVAVVVVVLALVLYVGLRQERRERRSGKQRDD